MGTIWLIRHGECVISTGAAFTTFAGAPLTQLGHQQAQQVAALFHAPPAVVVTSPYLRTRQTAESTMRRFPHLRPEEWPIHEFTYLTFPTDRAVTASELQPEVEAYWERCDPDYCAGPDAESFATFMRRVQTTLTMLRQRPEPFIALFTHELFMTAVTWLLLTRPEEITAAHMRQFHAYAQAKKWPNTAVLKLRMDDDLWIDSIMTTHMTGA